MCGHPASHPLRSGGRLTLTKLGVARTINVMTSPRPDETLDTLAEAAFAAYQRLCRSQGIDWQADLTEARLAGIEACVHAADQLAAAVGATPPTTSWSLAGCPPETAALLATSTDMGRRALAAGSTHTPLNVIRALANDPDWMIRAAVAGNTHIGADITNQLASDPDARVRAPLARHSRDQHLLTRLAAGTDGHDPHDIVAQEIAANPHTDAGTLAQLAEHESASIRMLVIANPSTADITLRALSDDPTARVRTAARDRLELRDLDRHPDED